jgi:hypothetical protein
MAQHTVTASVTIDMTGEVADFLADLSDQASDYTSGAVSEIALFGPQAARVTVPVTFTYNGDQDPAAYVASVSGTVVASVLNEAGRVSAVQFVNSEPVIETAVDTAQILADLRAALAAANAVVARYAAQESADVSN